MRNISDEICRENQNTNFKHLFQENRAVDEIREKWQKQQIAILHCARALHTE